MQCANHSFFFSPFFSLISLLDIRGQEQYLVYLDFHLFFCLTEHLYRQSQCSEDIKMNTLLSYFGAGFPSLIPFDILDQFFFVGADAL